MDSCHDNNITLLISFIVCHIIPLQNRLLHKSNLFIEGILYHKLHSGSLCMYYLVNELWLQCTWLERESPWSVMHTCIIKNLWLFSRMIFWFGFRVPKGNIFTRNTLPRFANHKCCTEPFMHPGRNTSSSAYKCKTQWWCIWSG